MGARARGARAPPMLFRTFLITFLSFVDFYLCIYIKTYKNIELYYKYRLWLQPDPFFVVFLKPFLDGEQALPRAFFSKNALFKKFSFVLFLF